MDTSRQASYETVPPQSPCRVLWQARLPGSVISVRSTPNCSLCVVASVDRSVSVFDASGQLLWSQRLDHEGWASAVSADASRVAVGTANKAPALGTVHVFSGSGVLLWRQSYAAPVWSVALSHSGRTLVVSRWDGCVAVYREEAGNYRLVADRRVGKAGLYGADIRADEEMIAVAAYEEGVVIADTQLESVKVLEAATGLYNVRFIPGTDRIIVGTRDGCVAVGRPGEPLVIGPRRLSARPICGVAASSDGALFAAGGFDGRVVLLTADGWPLWSLTTNGEVWSVDMSLDGGLVLVGAGDGTVQLVSSEVTSAAAVEIGCAESRLAREVGWSERRDACAALVACYLRYGVIEYGVARLRDLLGSETELSAEAGRRMLECDVAAHPYHYRSWYALADLLRSSREWHGAARAYLEASNGPELRMDSLLGAGQSLQQAGLETAALSCFRRARQQELIEDERRVLYNLGRSYEDAGNTREARKHYEILFANEPNYRDVYVRIASLAQGATPEEMAAQREVDYTGLTVSLLGPDVPRLNQVDESLRGVLDARSRELSVGSEERAALAAELAWLSEKGLIGKKKQTLEYDIASYTRYDNLVPEDEIVKLLELLNVLALLREIVPLKRTLDIGTATGRHPGVMSLRGVEAVGVDVEPRAIEYARAKATPGSNVTFVVADGRHLPFPDQSFDVITCMMGTIAHLEPTQQAEVSRESLRCLRAGGAFIVSTWDVACRHLAFLSMYSHDEREQIRSRSLTREATVAMFATEGFTDVVVRPFVMLPDVFSYELGVQGLTQSDLHRLLEVDLAARATFPDSHGEMFIVCGRRPSN